MAEGMEIIRRITPEEEYNAGLVIFRQGGVHPLEDSRSIGFEVAAVDVAFLGIFARGGGVCRIQPKAQVKARFPRGEDRRRHRLVAMVDLDHVALAEGAQAHDSRNRNRALVALEVRKADS